MRQQSEYFDIPTDDEGLGAAAAPAAAKPLNAQQQQQMAIIASAANLEKTQTYVFMAAALMLAGVVAYGAIFGRKG